MDLAALVLPALPPLVYERMPGAAVRSAPAAYRRHEPEKTVLYNVVAGHLVTYLDRSRADDHGLPAYVEKELRRYLECGVPAHGFMRLYCENCGESRVVALSCKGRGFCPSCLGRRMADTAAG